MAGKTKGERALMAMLKSEGVGGATVVRSKRHLVVMIPTPHGSRRLVAPTTPSCHRAMKNLRATVRRMKRDTR